MKPDEREVKTEIEIWEMEMNEMRYKYNIGEISEEQFDNGLADMMVRVMIYMNGEMND